MEEAKATEENFLDGRHSRTIRLVGEEAVERLWKSKVFVAGLGGVGSYVVEALARAGVGNFVLLDKDRVVESNINRQLVASYHTLGQLKTDVAAERILSINPHAQVTCLPLFYGKETASQVDFSGCDFIADAIDNVTGKLLLAEAAFEKKIPIISSKGHTEVLEMSAILQALGLQTFLKPPCVPWLVLCVENCGSEALPRATPWCIPLSCPTQKSTVRHPPAFHLCLLLQDF